MEIAEFNKKISENKKSFPLRNILQLYLTSRGRAEFFGSSGDELDLFISWLGPIQLPEGISEFQVTPVLALSELTELSNIFWRNRHHPIDIPKYILFYTLIEIHYGPQIASAIALYTNKETSVSEETAAL